MTHISVDVERHGGFWRITAYIDGAVKPTTVFGCRESITPIVAALLRAEGEQHAGWSAPHADMRGMPAAITFHLPGKRAVTYAIILPEQPLADGPQLPARALGSGG
jgi:hypothetical protein